jgi:hypothetical protein
MSNDKVRETLNSNRGGHRYGRIDTMGEITHDGQGKGKEREETDFDGLLQ